MAIRMDRRSFVTGGMSLALSRPMLRAQSAATMTAPRGLLSKTFAPLHGSLLAPGAWRPYPLPGEPGWSAVPKQVRDGVIASADAAMASAWPGMLATDELEFKRNGNRSRFEAISFGRRSRLGDLVLAECMTNTGKYLDQIANGVWLICEESFWGVPAHLYIQKADLGLPDPREPIVDLFAAETAALLATAVYLLGDTLDLVNPLVRERVIFEAERRVMEPCLKQNFMWMGLPGGKPRHDLPWLEDPQHGEVQPVKPLLGIDSE